MSDAKPDILIVEDDAAISTGLALNFKISGFTSTVIDDGNLAIPQIAAQRPDLVLLDINLPHQDGLQVLQSLRDSGDETPVIVLSARHDEHDKVAALRMGADDYVTKPFALAELMARIDAVLRRTRSGGTQTRGDADTLRFADVEVHLDTRTVLRQGQDVSLTHLEFELMRHFVKFPRRVFSRWELLQRVWGVERAASPRTVDNFVAQLRGKLESDPENPVHFITVRGSGYRFEPGPVDG